MDTTMPGAAGRRNPLRLPVLPLATGFRLAALWHLFGAAASAVALLATLNPSGEALPTVVRLVATAFWIAAVTANLAAAAWLARAPVTSRARSLALAVDYLVLVVAGVTLLHRLGVFRGVNAFADQFTSGIRALPIVLVGVAWTVVARRLAERAGRPPAVGALARAGRIVTIAGGVVFLALMDLPGALALGAERLADPLTFGALVLALGAGLTFRFLWSTRVQVALGIDRATQEGLTGALFLSPNLLGFGAFFAGPLLFSLVISFFDWDAFGGTRDFIGVDNYVRILSLQFVDVSGNANALPADVLKDGYQRLLSIDWFGLDVMIGARDVLFWTSLRNIAVFLLLAVPLSVLPALALSTLLNQRLPAMRFFRAVYFVPSVAGVIGISLIWSQMLNATVGWINYLRTEWASWFSFLPFVDEPTAPFQDPWMSSSSTALLAVVVVFSWMTFGFNTILYLAGHQSIPGDLYEAAELDGANAWKTFWRITVPQLRNTTFYVVATTAILAMQLFDIVYVLPDPPGGPANATLTPVLHLYNEGFQSSRHGYASAVAWVLFLLIMGLTVVQFRRQREEAR